MAMCSHAAVAFLCVVTAFCCICEAVGDHEEMEQAGSAEDRLVLHLHNETGDDNLCTIPGSNVSCRSLEHIASSVAGFVGSVEIVIQSSGLILGEPVTFSNTSGINIVSKTPTTIACTRNSFAGLVFIMVESLYVENLTLLECGAIQNYSVETGERKDILFRSAVHAISCSNVTVVKTSVVSSKGAGIAIVDSQGGVVNVSHCQLIKNAVPKDDRYSYSGGGGIYVRTRRPGRPNEYHFSNCLFVQNRPSTTEDYVFVTSFGGTGRGGGLDIVLRGSTAFNRIRISRCNFTGNTAFLGGGLAIQMEGRVFNNSAIVEDSVFERNGCPHSMGHSGAGSGGGAHFGYNFYSKDVQQTTDNNFSVTNVTFRENCAELGGGATFFSSRSDYADFNNSVSFANSTWFHNSARIGAAVDISPHLFQRLSGGFLPMPVFMNCSFIANTVVYRTQDFHQAYGTGALFSSLIDVAFKTSVYFEGNSGSAFMIVNGIANFSTCNATFVNNTGIQGGAIALIGISSMLIGPGCYYTFINNQAADRGGAIYSYLIDDHDFSISRSCFIQYLDEPGVITPPPEWNTTLTFTGNSATKYGHAIFATSLIPCQRRVSRSSNRGMGATWSASEILQWPGVFIYDNSTNGINHIATEGAHFNITGSLPFEIIPGEEHSLQVAIVDDLDQMTDSTFRGSIVDENSTISVDKAFVCVAGNVIQLQGEEGDSGKLLLQTVTPRRSSILVEVILAPCPPGFTIGNDMECFCNSFSFVGITKCNYTEFHVYIRRGFWAGYITSEDNKSAFVTTICPLGFCSYNGSDLSHDVSLPSNHSILDPSICGPKRTGILCGKCSPGYTVYYHSPNYNCKEERLCEVGWLFYILSELIPVTLLFVVILLLNMSFSSGAVNGFILFTQLIDTLLVGASGAIELPAAVDYLSAGYRLIYGFFNLDLFKVEFLSFCIWKDATVLNILAFKYVTIAYALILILGVILFSKHCGRRCLGKYIRITTVKTSVIHGLSAFLVICYAQCVRVSLALLLPVSLKGREGVQYRPSRVWFNGEIEQFSREHLPYAIPAIVCLLTIGTIPPVLLLTYPLINKFLDFCGLSESKVTTLLSLKASKLKPFLDTFQGCFKNELRFFAGLYFLYRWIGLAVYSITTTLNDFYAGVEGLLIFTLVLHAVAQPYEKRWHNIVDALLLADLAIINGLSGYYYSQATNDINTPYLLDASIYIQLILIYLPILYIVIYVIIVCHKKYHAWKKQNLTAHAGEGEHTTEEWDPADQERQPSGSSSTSLDEFPARLLGDDVEYHWVTES